MIYEDLPYLGLWIFPINTEGFAGRQICAPPSPNSSSASFPLELSCLALSLDEGLTLGLTSLRWTGLRGSQSAR